MDQLREGINLRAFGQKNPLLEYKTEGFQLFQEMMADMNRTTVQRLFRTRIQGLERAPQVAQQRVRNVRIQHEDTTGMGFTGQPTAARQEAPNRPQQASRIPVKAGPKIGRNEKITVVSPKGEKIQIKYKKLQQYINRGYTQV